MNIVRHEAQRPRGRMSGGAGGLEGWETGELGGLGRGGHRGTQEYAECLDTFLRRSRGHDHV